MKPSCRDVCEQSTALLDGDPCGTDWEALQHHAEHCPACGEYLRQLGLTVEALRLLPRGCSEKARGDLLGHYEAWLASRQDG